MTSDPFHPVTAYLDTLSPASRRQALSALKSVHRLASGEPGFCWTKLDRRRLESIRKRLAARYAAATVRHMLSVTRGVMRAARADLAARADDEFPGQALVPVNPAGVPGFATAPSPARVYLASLSAGPSRQSSQSALNRLVDIAGFLAGRDYGALDDFPWARLRASETIALRAELARRYAPATANRMLSCLRGVLRTAWRLEQISMEDYRRAADIAAVRGTRLPAGRAVREAELERLFAACRKDGAMAARDAAALALLYAGGLRRAEACSLNTRDLNLETGEIRVIGKGNRQRRLWLADGALDALRRWMEARGGVPGPVLARLRRGGAIAPTLGISGDALMRRLQDCARRAGIDPLTPHDLRRSFVSDSLDAGTDIAVVQRLAGHASPVTTARYDRRGDAALKQASRRLRVPFDGPAAARPSSLSPASPQALD